MPIFLLGEILLQILCVIHAVRTGRTQPWIMIIMFLPLVGCIAYLIVEIGPEMLASRRAQTVKTNLRKATDPDRDLRAAKREVEMVGSVNAKRTLAEEYMGRGMFADAIDLYRSAASGMHKDDPALLLGLARALLASGDGPGTQAVLDALQAANPEFSSYEAHMIYARALEMQGKGEEALAEYEALTRYFPGEEARVRFGLLLKKAGRTEQARAVFGEVLKLLDGAPKHCRRAQKEWGDIARRNIGG